MLNIKKLRVKFYREPNLQVKIFQLERVLYGL